MSKTRTRSLSQPMKVTRQDIRDAQAGERRRERRREKAKDERLAPQEEDRSLVNPRFKDTFSFLQSQGVFRVENARTETQVSYKGRGVETVRNKPTDGGMVVACQLFDGSEEKMTELAADKSMVTEIPPRSDIDSVLDRLRNDGIKSLVDHFQQEKWQYKAIHDLRYGRRPFVVKKEPEYFHEAFRLVVGDVWADTLEPLDFVLGDIHQILKNIMTGSLPINWENSAPEHLLHIANHSQQAGVQAEKRIKPELVIQKVADTRLSDHGNEGLDEYAPLELDSQLSIGDEYQLRIFGVPEGWTSTVIEFREHPLAHKSGNGQVKAQLCDGVFEQKPDLVVKKRDGRYLLAPSSPGQYGYCIIAEKEPFFAQAYANPADDRLLSPDCFHAIARKVVDACLPNDDVAIGVLDYFVSS